MTITIDIISDVICPWCFIGKRRLERAMKQFTQSHPDADFKVTWHPFYLASADAPVTNKLERYVARMGADKVRQMLPYMQSVGRTEGIEFDYGGDIGGTVVPHRLIDYAQTKEPEKTNVVVETLFKSYFERQGNVFTVPALMTLLKSEKVDLNLTEAEKYLQDMKGRQEMNETVARGNIGVTGVPFFTVNGIYKLSGAQEPEAFLELFGQVAK